MINKIKITTQYIKLDSLLKFSGMAQTGGVAKEYITNGEVKVNGEICLMRGKKLYNGDIVEHKDDSAEVVQGED